MRMDYARIVCVFGTEFILLRTDSSAWVVEMQQRTFIFCKGQGVDLLAERLLLSQEGLRGRQFLLFTLTLLGLEAC
jgi:hypothetical protein